MEKLRNFLKRKDIVFSAMYTIGSRTEKIA